MANALPERIAVPLASQAGKAAASFMGTRSVVVGRNQIRVGGGTLDASTTERRVRGAFASYGRYWMESFRLPSLDPVALAEQFSIEGLGHIEAARVAGKGAILAIPHLGGWEVGGAWFVRRGFPLTVVVEPVEPPELFDWFVKLRESFGFKVIPLGPRAGMAVVRALRANQVVALLADRDIGGGGVDVKFFGETTKLPGGPAALARRMGAPLLPTAIYFDGRGHHAVVRPPVPLDGSVEDVTQRLAGELETLIRRAPEQWHLFQPNWPSDRENTV